MLQRPSGRAVAALAAAFMIVTGPGRARAQGTGGMPTAEEARAFVEAAEQRLLELSAKAGRAAWVQANFITDDTERIAADLNGPQGGLEVGRARLWPARRASAHPSDAPAPSVLSRNA